MKTKTTVSIGIVVILFILGYFLILQPEEVEKTTGEKINDWIESGQAKVILDGEEILIDSAELNDEKTNVIVRDVEGNIIAIIPIEEFFESIENNEPITVEKPEPLPVPTPTPVPPPPAPTPVNVTVPVPTPIINQTNATNATPSPVPLPTPPNVTPAPGPYIPQCSNGQWDGDESDLDCGGSCAPCLNTGIYTACWVNSDCASNNCDMSAAQLLPAVDNVTGVSYNDYNSLRILAGQMWIIPYSGICR
ncbi:hypothetical protein ACFLZB_04635 [Nanoarchaeota archaeon]